MCDDSAVRRFGWLFVLLTVFLITFIPVTSRIYIMDPWLLYHGRSWLWTIPFDLSVLSIWYNYCMAVNKSPGTVPPNYSAEYKQIKVGRKQDQQLKTKEKTSTGNQRKPRWCSECLNFKPPRSHHCSYCNSCVLRMDHHCPWLNNCVGHENHPYFVRFVISVTLACLAGLLLIGTRIAEIMRYHTDLAEYYRSGFNASELRFTPPVTDVAILLVFNVVLLISLLLMVGGLSAFQLYYVAGNTTTIESFENDKVRTLHQQGKISNPGAYPYDLGYFKNFCMIFGPRWYLWWVPFGAFGDGIHFKTADNSKRSSWPPRNYYLFKKYPYGRKKDFPSHVRRGSEGYVVKTLSFDDREKLISNAPVDVIEDYESSTDFDSLDEFDNEEEMEKEGIPRQFQDSDNETLADRKQRINKSK